MKNLINGQSIRIEKHDAGSGREVSFDRALHIHKVMNRDRYNGAEIIIPLNVNENIYLKNVQGKSSVIESHIRNEIERAFKKPQKRAQFAEYLFNEVERYSHNQNDPIKLQNLIISAKAIARHFDLYPEIIKEVESRFKNRNENRISTYYSVHKDNEGNEFYIFQDLDGQNIRLGSDLEILKYWEETKRLFNS